MIRDFEYSAPKTVDEALSMLSEYGDEAKVLAGGQSLLILLRQRLVTPRYLIGIKSIADLDYIEYDGNEGLRIGSLTSHRSIENSSVIKERFSVLAEMERRLASIQTRNWGTIGGNLCHADPAGDAAPPLIALNAKLKTASSSGGRLFALEEFSKDYYETTLQADEILTEIQVPIPPHRTGTAYGKFVLTKAAMPTAGVAVSITLGSRDRVCNDARIVLGAVAPVPMRAEAAEKVLIGETIEASTIERAAQVAAGEARPISDVHASAEYRRELINVLVKRVAAEALERAEVS